MEIWNGRMKSEELGMRECDGELKKRSYHCKSFGESESESERKERGEMLGWFLGGCWRES